MSRKILTGLPISRRLILGGVAAMAALGPAAPVLGAERFNPRIGWRNAAGGLDEARRTFRPIFMVVHADWCPACRTYSKDFDDPQIIERLKADFVPVLVNADDDRASATRFQPDGPYIPRTMVLSSKGELFEDVTGPFDHKFFLPPGQPDYLLAFMARGLARAKGDDDAIVMQDPVRKAVPGGDKGPSFQRPQLGTKRLGGSGASADAGGPKRMTVPGARSAPPNGTAPVLKGAPAPSAAGEVPQPGLIDRLLGKVL